MKKRWNVRDLVLVVHRWTGLTMAVFLVIVGLTGTLLAFRGHIDALFNPGLHIMHAPGQRQLSLAVLAERAEAELPHARLGFFAVEADQVIFHMVPRADPSTGKPYNDTELHLALNPYTGERLHCGPASNPGRACHDVMSFIYDLHTSLLTRTDLGWKFVGAVALVWTIDCFVAIVLTLPRSKGPFWPRWRQAWGVKWGASSTRVNYDFHRAGGLWVWSLLFVFAWSSVMLGLRVVYDPVMSAVFDFSNDNDFMAKNVIPVPLDNPKLNWRDAESIGAKTMGEQAVLHHFTVERPYGMAYIPEYGAYTYGVRSNLDLRGHGWDATVLIDGNTGQLRELDLPRGQHLGNTISTLLWGIHYGDLRDWLPYRILIGFFGVFLAILSYTGVVIWWRKRSVRRATARTKLQAAIALLLLGFAVSPIRSQSVSAQLSNAQSALIRKIEGRIMAPCCYTQTIRDHDSQVAEEMREEVTSMVASGKSEQEIITYYRTKYGETILVVPDGATGGLLTYTPVTVFLASVGLLLFFIKRTASTRETASSQLAPERTEAERLAFQEKIRTEIGEVW
jgi:uncharacterized iron-regulated membrane protein